MSKLDKAKFSPLSLINDIVDNSKELRSNPNTFWLDVNFMDEVPSSVKSNKKDETAIERQLLLV